MAMGMTAIESIVLLFLISAGNDLSTLVDPTEYFKSRNIPVTIEKMVELATTEPADGKTQLQQLLALRLLADDAAEVKKAKNFPDIFKSIEEVAGGKKAQDLQGFAAEAARNTAAALGSQIKPARNLAPENSVRQDALNWFPKDATFVFSLDLRYGNEKVSKEMVETRQKLIKVIPAQFKEIMYKFLEEVGNVRVERFSLAYQDAMQNKNDDKVFMRVTGKLDHKRLVAYLRKNMPQDMQFKESKSFRGKSITTFWEPKPHNPALALIGDNDLVFAGMAGFNPNQKDNLEILEEILDVQRGKQPSVLEGPLAAKLKQVSSAATGLMVGQIPSTLHRELTGAGPGPGPGFKAFPKEILVEMNYKDDALKFQLQAEMDNADDAKAFADSTNVLVQLGIAQIQNPPPLPPNFPKMDKIIKGTTDMLKSIKVEAKGKNISGQMSMGQDLLQAYTAFSLALVTELQGAAGPGAAPPPPPVPPRVEDAKKPLKDSRLNSPRRNPLTGVSVASRALTLPPNIVACRHGDNRETATTCVPA